MSLKLLGFILTVAATTISALPQVVGQEKIDAFGESIRGIAKKGQRLVREFGFPAVGTLLLLATALSGLGGNSPVPIEYLESSHHGLLHVLYMVVLVVTIITVVLVALASALAVILAVAWVLAWLVSKLPTGPKAIGVTAILLGVGAAYVAFVLA